jgi:hypothetical protein
LQEYFFILTLQFKPLGCLAVRCSSFYISSIVKDAS